MQIWRKKMMDEFSMENKTWVHSTEKLVDEKIHCSKDV